MNKFFRVLFFITFNFLILTISSFSEENKIKIGLLAPLTGENAHIGKQIINAVKMALKDIGSNEIELYPKDTKSNPKNTLASAIELEKLGIGRPSTYASIISRIQEAGYVRVENRRFYAEKIGDIVTVRLNESFTDLMDYGFTAAMENHLDDIANGQRDWKDVLNRFYADFSKSLSKAESKNGGMRPNEPTITDIKCQETACNRPMTVRTASTGVFLSCSGYTLPPK